jgi:hypothetical protein
VLFVCDEGRLCVSVCLLWCYDGIE